MFDGGFHVLEKDSSGYSVIVLSDFEIYFALAFASITQHHFSRSSVRKTMQFYYKTQAYRGPEALKQYRPFADTQTRFIISKR